MTGAWLAWLMAALLSVLALPAMAETFRLRSGEHADFSRLVLDGLPADTPWTLGRAGSEYELRLELEGAGFDTGQVYRLIPRSRLLAVEDAGGAALRLRVATDHHAMAFKTPGGALVIDIRAGPPPAGSRFEQPFDPQGEPAPVPAMGSAGYRPVVEPSPRLEVFWRGEVGAVAPAPSASVAARPLAPSLPDPRVVQAEADLMMQLGRAAAQGLVEIDVPDPRALVVPPEPLAPAPDGGGGVEDGVQAASEPPGIALPEMSASDPPAAPPGEPAPAGHFAIHAETSIDRAMANTIERPAVTSDGEACLPNAAVDLAAWGDARPFSEQLADAQVSLLGEFDRPDPPAVERLVKLYLYHGFGAEARATAAAFGLQEDSADLLLTLAQILDDGHARAPGPFAGMADCDTAAALWAVLAEARIAPGATVNHGAVLRGFSALPLHLRRALGPGLAERLIEAGATDTARAVRDAILRAPGDHGPALQMIDARLDLAQGKTAAAEAELGAVVRSDGPLGPEALILLIDSHLAEGRPVPPSLTEDAAALAFEHRAAALGPALTRAQVLALASVGDFAAASEELARAGSRWNPDVRRSLVRELAAMLSNWPDDAVFLARYFADRDLFDRADLPVDLRLDVAGRLLDSGFAAEARQALGPARTLAEGRMIVARAALVELDARQALALLAGMVGAEPAALRAEAYSLLSDHAAAAEAYRRAGLPDRAAAEHWRAGDWDAVRGNGTEPQRAVLALEPTADAAGPPGRLAPEEPVSLASGQALLEESRLARDAWSALLAAPGPVAPEAGSTAAAEPAD